VTSPGLIQLGLAAILAATLAGCAHSSSMGAAPRDLAETVPQLLRETKVPSVAVARVERYHVIWAAAWGQRGPRVPATADTLYNIASLTKPISAETLLRAASLGRLRIDEPMYRWWVDPDVAADPRHRRLTARLALTHRTGFPNWRYETGGKLVFKNEPGAVGYSGEGFEYVARYAELRTRTPFPRLADELVLRPARMRSTAYTRRSWFAGRIASPTDAAGKWLEPSVRSHYLASDDVYTTAGDYGLFLAGVAARQGLSRDLAEERERVQVSTQETPCSSRDGCADSAGFGLGWEVAVFGADHILWHTGADEGEFTFAYVIPRTGEGAVILTNSSVGYKMVLPILERIGTHPRFLAYLRAQAG
jgi:CubicO group peptidase (beta-lactamase class C family)